MSKLFGFLEQLLQPFVRLPVLVESVEVGLPQGQQPAPSLSWAILQLNRNARPPKKANHGARPCSSVMRRMKKKNYYRRWKEGTPSDDQDKPPT